MISVLIVNYHCANLTCTAVKSVLAEEMEVEVIVVDNSANEGELNHLRRALPSEVILLSNGRNAGFGKACNWAYQQSQGSMILLLNPDAYILPGCLQKLVSTMERYPKTGAISPVAQWDETGVFLLPPGQTQTPSWEWMLAIGLRLPVFGHWLSMRFRTYALQCLYASQPISQGMLSGGHMFLRRSAIDAVGGLFDPTFFMYYEDTDLCRRLTKAGFELMLTPEAKVVHQWRNDPAKSQYTTRSRLHYMRKHFSNIWLMDRLRQKFEQLLPPKIGQFHDLGICSTAPIFDLPSDQNGNWLLELSPNPLLIPAAYHSSSVVPSSIPSSVWDLLGPGRYWTRVSQPNGQWSYFTWEIPKSAAEPSLQIPPQKRVENSTQMWQLNWAHPCDEAELLALFCVAFEHDVPPELWRWKYQGLDTLGALVRDDSQVVAFYGAMPRAIHLFGSPTTAVQIGDVMVLPKKRGILTRKGPFFLAATSFSERFIGNDKLFPLAFGFPSERHFRLGVHLGLYEQVGDLMRVSWPALQARPNYKVSIRPLSLDKGATVDWLWLEMAEALQDQIIGVRDWGYLQRRYLNHPTLNYQVFLISSRWTGYPIGIFVVRILEDSVELIDIIASPKRIPLLIDSVRRLTWNLNKPLAYTWITAQNAPLLAGKAGEITPTNIPLPNICWTPGIPARELLNRWWLMGGDTDFR